MVANTSATPLIALDAVVLDTETTGVDPTSARIVEIAAVRLVGGKMAAQNALRRLVRPDQPIPATATRIHGINDAAVAGATPFAEVWPEFVSFIGDSVVIGHALGFDLAVIRRECERSGVPWEPPRAIDTRLLAQAIKPNLADYSLEGLAAWVGTKVEHRHSALGDAITCGGIFLALLPKLRAAGIRTLAEAEAACRAQTEAIEQHRRAGWVPPVGETGTSAAESILGRIDSYPFCHRVSEVMQPAQFIAADRPLREALARMMQARISSVFVVPPQTEAAPLTAVATGIFTERDLLRAIAREGGQVLDQPIERFATRPLAVIAADAFIYRAIEMMRRLKVRHLGVVDAAGRIVAAVTARDLLRTRAEEAVELGAQIDLAKDVPSLAAAWARIPRVAASLMREEVPARDIAAVISAELRSLTAQAATIAEERMRNHGHGDPPCAYAVAVLGSAGRGESLLAMDQDNALFFASGAPGGAEDRWFEAFATYLADHLHEAGVPYCAGGVMAKNALWRGSLATWQQRIAEWIGRSNPEDLLSVDIFFDLRGVGGDISMAERLRAHAFDAAAGQFTFVKLLIEAAGPVAAGLTMLGGFRTEQGRINLKRTGLFPIVTAARALAIAHHVLDRSTEERLTAIKNLAIGGHQDLEALLEAQSVFLELVLAQQLADIQAGVPPSNAVSVKRLSRPERARLRQALRAVQPIEVLIRDLLFKN
jgi:DNA polymerase-3 subunit epsilon/CBS domain-containing protein